MNLELLKAGYPPYVITVETCLAYYEALDQWIAFGKTEVFNQLVANAVLEHISSGFRNLACQELGLYT